MSVLFCDIESYSTVPIKNGVYRYLKGVELLIFQCALDDGAVSVSDIANGDTIPTWALDALADPKVMLCSHTSFDRVVLEHLGLSKAPIERWIDTSAQARAHGLPGKLSLLCEIFKLPPELRKLDGRDHIQLFCKPLPLNAKLERATKQTHPAEWTEFLSYAGRDVEAMRALYKRMPRWNFGEKALAQYHLDQRINDRGVCVDTPFVRAAVESVKRCKKLLDAEAVDLTDGAIESANQRDKLLAHLLAEHGVSLPDMTKTTLERRLEDEELPAVVREIIRVRLATATASTAKYAALTRSVSEDGRLRGTLLWRGASRTGRWAGRLFQPQNMSRIPKWIYPIYDQCAEAITAGGVDLLFDKPMEVLGSLVRACIVAPPGEKLVVADLSNIEGRILAWLAGEAWKVKAFAELDAGRGEDLYILTGSRVFGIPVADIKADEAAGGSLRLHSKVAELACGYQGATGAFDSMAQVYNVVLPQDEQIRVVKAWRAANPNIAKFWYTMERAAKAAVLQPNKRFNAGAFLSFERTGGWLRMHLPSGRLLCYASPKINEDGQLTYMGVNSYTRKFERLETYGGKLTENACQAVALDVMEESMPRAEAAEYVVSLTFHDELICEAPDAPEFTGEALADIMRRVPEWAPGLPLNAKGFETQRYRK